MYMYVSVFVVPWWLVGGEGPYGPLPTAGGGLSTINITIISVTIIDITITTTVLLIVLQTLLLFGGFWEKGLMGLCPGRGLIVFSVIRLVIQ